MDEHPLDRLLPPGFVIDDRYKILGPFSRQGSYSRMYEVSCLRRFNDTALLKVNVTEEFAKPGISDRAKRGLRQLTPEMRSFNEVSNITLCDSPFLPVVEGTVSLTGGLEGLVYQSRCRTGVLTLQQAMEEGMFGDAGLENGRDPHVLHGELMDPHLVMQGMMRTLRFPYVLLSSITTDVPEERQQNITFPLKRIMHHSRTETDSLLPLVHNDIKPDNLLLDRKYWSSPPRPGLELPGAIHARDVPVMLLDWALSMYDTTVAQSSEGLQDSARVSQDALRGVFGSRSYSDPRSFLPHVAERCPFIYQDVWSLFAVNYETITGKRFHNDELARIVAEHHAEPAVLEHEATRFVAQRSLDIAYQLKKMYETFLTATITVCFAEEDKPALHRHLDKLRADEFFPTDIMNFGDALYAKLADAYPRWVSVVSTLSFDRADACPVQWRRREADTSLVNGQARSDTPLIAAAYLAHHEWLVRPHVTRNLPVHTTVSGKERGGWLLDTSFPSLLAHEANVRAHMLKTRAQ